MPEMTFELRWPDGSIQRCYSPSLVMHDYLSVGARYTVADFLDRSTQALAEASERVRTRFGFACTSAAETQQRIVLAAKCFSTSDLIEVTSMHPSLEQS